MRLAVDIEYFSILRKIRQAKKPDPVTFIPLIEIAGGQGIICHLREDQTLLRERDITIIKEIVQTHLNLCIVPTEEMVKFALSIVPDMVTFIPEKRNEFMSQGGLDVILNEQLFMELTDTLRTNNIIVSLFVPPDINQIKSAVKTGADYIEIDTNPYSTSPDLNTQIVESENLKSVTSAAVKLRLGVSMGRGLDYHNVQNIMKIPYVEEINIGFAIVSRAMYVGIQQAVSDMISILK